MMLIKKQQTSAHTGLHTHKIRGELYERLQCWCVWKQKKAAPSFDTFDKQKRMNICPHQPAEPKLTIGMGSPTGAAPDSPVDPLPAVSLDLIAAHPSTTTTTTTTKTQHNLPHSRRVCVRLRPLLGRKVSNRGALLPFSAFPEERWPGTPTAKTECKHKAQENCRSACVWSADELRKIKETAAPARGQPVDSARARKTQQLREKERDKGLLTSDGKNEVYVESIPASFLESIPESRCEIVFRDRLRIWRPIPIPELIPELILIS